MLPGRASIHGIASLMETQWHTGEVLGFPGPVATNGKHSICGPVKVQMTQTVGGSCSDRCCCNTTVWCEGQNNTKETLAQYKARIIFQVPSPLLHIIVDTVGRP